MKADLLSFDGSPADVQGIAAGLGLSIDLYQPFRDFAAMPEPAHQRNLEREAPARCGAGHKRAARRSLFGK